MNVLLKTSFFDENTLKEKILEIANKTGVPVIIKDKCEMGEVKILNNEISFNKYNAYLEFETEQEMLDFFNTNK